MALWKLWFGRQTPEEHLSEIIINYDKLIVKLENILCCCPDGKRKELVKKRLAIARQHQIDAKNKLDAMRGCSN